MVISFFKMFIISLQIRVQHLQRTKYRNTSICLETIIFYPQPIICIVCIVFKATMYILYIPTRQTTTTNDIISLIQHSFLYP